jgi:hypothetical protein
MRRAIVDANARVELTVGQASACLVLIFVELAEVKRGQAEAYPTEVILPTSL